MGAQRLVALILDLVMVLMNRNWNPLRKPKSVDQSPAAAEPVVVHTTKSSTREAPISPDDPLLKHFLSVQGYVEIEKLDLDSAALRSLRQEGVKITIPLISQGELIGLLNLGARLSEQDYSTDDRRLLNTLVTQAAPALRVAQLARQQQAEARHLERMEQELRVARVIQETLLPKELPTLEGGNITAYWRPAREVSGDFYDFIDFPDGRLGIVIADVTDKGVPAALVMATTRTILRAASERLFSPGEILERANELLSPDIPRNMFITCLYLVLDPHSGKIVFANAGHNLPYKHTPTGIEELRATGMPLGLLPGMKYEDKEATLGAGESLLIYSDGLIEAHNPLGEMYGFPRLKQFFTQHDQSDRTIDLIMEDLAAFTGGEWVQEDDVTIVFIERLAEPALPTTLLESPQEWFAVSEFSIASEPSNEREVMDIVAGFVSELGITGTKLERVRTAVAEATMNATEHGNRYQAELPVEIGIFSIESAVLIKITDQGGGRDAPVAAKPDIEAKLAGMQSPRGWGLFLIESMVDEMRVVTNGNQHTLELLFRIEGA